MLNLKKKKTQKKKKIWEFCENQNVCQIMGLTYFCCKVGQSVLIAIKLKLYVSCHLPKVYPKFQIDISKYVEKKSAKLERTDDGQTDGQTGGRMSSWHNMTIVERVYKKSGNVIKCTKYKPRI